MPLREKLFPRISHLEKVREKIRGDKPVSIGVFCSGNGDRSPFAQQVLQEEFKKAGHKNVRVFSFGLSAPEEEKGEGAAKRTAGHALDMGYEGIRSHVRRSVRDDSVKDDIQKADLLFAISPSHLLYLLEYGADEGEPALREKLHKLWTLKGFATKREWKMPVQGLKIIPFIGSAMRRSLSVKDPYFQPKTEAGEEQFRKMLEAVRDTAKLAAKRLIAR